MIVKRITRRVISGILFKSLFISIQTKNKFDILCDGNQSRDEVKHLALEIAITMEYTVRNFTKSTRISRDTIITDGVLITSIVADVTLKT